jgi:hypothetical protein
MKTGGKTMNRSISRALSSCAVALALAACGQAESTGPSFTRNEPSEIFLVQAAPPAAVMDALFQGRVSRDLQGCLRMEGLGDRHTVIWPHGFTLVERGGELFVRDAAGRDVGRIGGSFRFGGGESSTLHQGLLSDESRQLAESRCPGRYWIVGEV